jgi:hypothetical protein
MEVVDWTNQGTRIEHRMAHRKPYQFPSIVSTGGDCSNQVEAERRKANRLKLELTNSNVSLGVGDGQNGIIVIRYMAPCMCV